MAMIVVMGVSGSGKTSVAAALAKRLAVPFLEGDTLHSDANHAKMAAGLPLDDADRAPWLAAVADWMAAHPAGVVACSALRRAYRDRLREGAPAARFVLLHPPPAVLEARLAQRTGHFMPPSLLPSQLATLEMPDADERALVLADDFTVAVAVERIGTWVDP